MAKQENGFQASQKATDWLIRLRDAPKDADLRHRFQVWLESHPDNAAAWRTTQHTAETIGKIAPAYAESWRPFLEKRHRVAARRKRRTFQLAAAAACLLALACGPKIWWQAQADYHTGTGQTRIVQLADLSTVTLAPHSAIDVVYTAGERRIRLLAGEAFFEVTPDAVRPFRVATKTLNATVLGTGFDIRDNEIGVVHGVVRVAPSGASGRTQKLTAGQTVRVERTRIDCGTKPTSQIAAWRRGQLVAQDQSMADVVDQLRPYYAGMIVITDSALAKRPVTGLYDLKNPALALAAIARAQNATVRRITPWLLVVSAS